MASASESQIHTAILNDYGVDTRSVEFRTVDDQVSALITDVVRIRSHPLLPAGLVVGGAIFDVHSGILEPIKA
jgi:carbonic anhydrase